MLRAKAGQHTLSCGACGAPLGSLKVIPSAEPEKPAAVTHQPVMPKPRKVEKAARPKPVKKRKKRKSLFRRFTEEVFDFAEDAFDIVEDIFD